MIDVSTSKTGKHGHAKCNFTATDIFTGKKLEDMCPSTHNVDVRPSPSGSQDNQCRMCTLQSWSQACLAHN